MRIPWAAWSVTLLLACAAPAAAVPFAVTAGTYATEGVDDVVVTTSGDFVTLVTTGSSRPEEPVIARWTPGGVLEWALVLEAPSSNVRVAATPDDSVVVTGNPASQQAWIASVDASGRIAWSRVVADRWWTTSWIHDVAVVDGRVVIRGASSGPWVSRWIAALDPGGAEHAAVETSTSPEHADDGPVAALGTGDVTCLLRSPSVDAQELTCFDMAVTRIEHRAIRGGRARFSALETMPGGGLLLSDEHGTLVVIGSDLSVRWSASVAGGGAVRAWPLGGDAVAVAATEPHDGRPIAARIDGASLTWQGVISELETQHVCGASSTDGALVIGAATTPKLPTRGDAFVARVEGDGSSSCGTSSTALVLSPETYELVAVAGDDVGPVPISTSPGALTARTWPARALRTCGTCASDDGEPDGCGEAASPLAAGGSLARNFCDDAEDAAFFTACAGTPHVIWTSALGSAVDTVLEVWSADCATLLARDDDSGGGRASAVTFVPPDDGVYRAVVRSKDGSTGPGHDYELHADAACSWPQWERTANGARSVADGRDTWIAVADPLAPNTLTVTRLDAAGSELSSRTVASAPGAASTGSMRAARGIVAVPADFGIVRMPSQDAPADVLATSDLLLGVDDDGSVLIGSATLSRILPNGAAAWTINDVPLLPGTVSTTIRGALTGDGGAIAAVRPQTEGSVSTVARVDAAGDVLWTTAVGGFRAVDGRGGMLLNFSACYDASADVLVLVADRDFAVLDGSDGRLLWSRGFAVRTSVVPEGHGRLLLVSAEPGLATLDARSGALLWSSTCTRDHPLALGDVSVASDGGLVAMSGARVLRLDPLGFGPCSIAGPYMPDLRPADIATTSPQHAFVRRAPSAPPEHAVTPSPARALLVDACRQAGSPCPGLTIAIAGPATACEGTDVLLRAVVGGVDPVAIEWDLDWDGVGFDVDATGTRAGGLTAVGVHHVVARATDDCGGPRRAVASLDYEVFARPVLELAAPDVACKGDCVPVQATPGFASYSWSRSQDTTAATCVVVQDDTTVRVTVRDARGCSWSATHDIAVTPIVPAFTDACESDLHRLTVSASGMASATWSTGETASSILAPPGTYSVTVTVTDALGCSATGTVTTRGTCGPPREVSGPPWTSPLRVTGTNVSTITFEDVSETSYGVLVGAIGQWTPSWLSSPCAVTCAPTGPGRCGYAWYLPPGSFVVVTASNRMGEGPAGARSDGSDRSTVSGWSGCGPTR